MCKPIPTLSNLRQSRFENIVGKGENAGGPAFSTFPTMCSIFFKAFHYFSQNKFIFDCN